MNPEREKICAACGRSMHRRRRWDDRWDRVKYCSRRCREWRGNAPLDRRLEESILEVLRSAPGGTSVTPTEIARRLKPEGWRTLRERARCAARRLAARGRIEVLERGRRVDAARSRGPIRLRLRRR